MDRKVRTLQQEGEQDDTLLVSIECDSERVQQSISHEDHSTKLVSLSSIKKRDLLMRDELVVEMQLEISPYTNFRLQMEAEKKRWPVSMRNTMALLFKNSKRLSMLESMRKPRNMRSITYSSGQEKKIESVRQIWG